MDSKLYIKKLNSKWRIETIKVSHNIGLRYGIYQNNPEVEMRRCIVYLNGRTEWIEKNMEIPECLSLPDDCGFLTWDHRGQGASDGERSWIDDYQTYVDDAYKIIEEELGGIPYAMLAHSTGGLIGMLGILRGAFTPEAFATSAPLFGLPNAPIPRMIAKPVSRVLSFTPLRKLPTGAGSFDDATFESNHLTHDHDMYLVQNHSPYRIPSATFGWVHATFQAIDFIHDPFRIANLKTPTLILIGSKECVVDPNGISSWVAIANDKTPVEVQMETIPGARHELFSEVTKFRSVALQKCKSWYREFLS